MSDNPNPVAAQAPPKGMARKWLFGVLALAFLFVLMPFLFWKATWFGSPLTDEELQKNLTDLEHPRKTQHALAQIAERMMRKDPAVKQWYPQVAALAGHKVDEIRTTAAWAMGQDNSVPEFHQALLRLGADPNALVRRNAALALVRFNDDSGHREIVSMLQPYVMAATHAGTLSERLKPGDVVNPGTLLGRIKSGDKEIEIRAAVPGTLERWLVIDGSAVTRAQEILSISPDSTTVWEALRGLVLVGRAEDLREIEPYARGVAGMPEQVRQQAQEAMTAIKQRSSGQSQ